VCPVVVVAVHGEHCPGAAAQVAQARDLARGDPLRLVVDRAPERVAVEGERHRQDAWVITLVEQPKVRDRRRFQHRNRPGG